jgi:hypothetical protein
MTEYDKLLNETRAKTEAFSKSIAIDKDYKESKMEATSD